MDDHLDVSNTVNSKTSIRANCGTTVALIHMRGVTELVITLCRTICAVILDVSVGTWNLLFMTQHIDWSSYRAFVNLEL